jgi:exosortase/archaeosortase family protein
VWRDEGTRFVVSFALIAGCLLALYYSPRGNESAVERFTSQYLCAYTRLVSYGIGVFDPHAFAHGNVVTGRFSMQIVKSCDAMEANILFAAAFVALPAVWWRKAASLLAGLMALCVFNLLRLFVLYWVGVFVPKSFDFLHYDVWPLLMIAFAAVDFIVCVHWARRSDGGGLLASRGVDGSVAG